MSRKTVERPRSKPAPAKPVAPPRSTSMRTKVIAFAGLVAVCLGVGVAVLLSGQSDDPKSGTPQLPSVNLSPLQWAALMSAPHLLFVNTDLGDAYSKVEVVPLSDPQGPRAVSPLTCNRVAATNNIGVCLVTHQGVVTKVEGEIFDSTFHVLHKFKLPGLPSRARMSPDGHWAAMTVFTSGDAYGAPGSFSTRTSFVNTTTGKSIGNLEQFHVTDGGSTVTAVNRNYWGVTFENDSDHFYATLARGTNIQLIEGSVSSRSAHTLRSGIECPSLSPDQTRVAYKSRTGGTLTAVRWRLHVYNLKTGQDITLAEPRSVDDQVEWLDNNTVLYARLRSPSGSVAQDMYRLPADGTGQPELYVKGSYSPAVGSGSAADVTAR